MTEENTPGRQAMSVMESVRKDIVFKKPSSLPRKRRAKKVLDEEKYVEEIGKIIQRDFFPDLEKVTAQNEYLEAMDKNDMIRMRELYMKYSGKKPTVERMPSPATFETPANIHNSQNITETNSETESVKSDTEKSKENKLSLDQYLNSHTSEDNDSFELILKEARLKHIQKYEFLYGEEEKTKAFNERLVALPSIEEQAKLPIKSLNLNMWGYKNQNYIMYNPDGVEMTPEKEIEILSKKQEIVHENTRLKTNPFNDYQSKETINELAKTQAKVLDGKIGVDGKEILKVDTPKIGGFSFVRTPSPSPSVLGSPLMTWGEIEGTPFRLDGSDTPLARSKGPSFKMAQPPRREQLAFALAEKVGEKNRDQKKRALDAQRRQFASPSPRPNTSSIDRLATMSPAARRLATSHLRIGVSSDLRSVYSPSPNRQKTPVISTPKRLTTPKGRLVTPNKGSATPKSGLATPKGGLSSEKSGITKEVSTDDLLNIRFSKRQTAADFF